MHTPSLLQMEVAECGAASLGIVLAYHGRVVPLPELRTECGVSRDGSNAASLVQAARRYGLVATGYSKEVEGLRELEPPFVVFWGFNHFLVVEGFGRDKVFLNDPAVGHRTVSLREFEREFTGVVLILEPGPDFRPGGRRPSVRRALRRRLTGFGAGLAFAVFAGFLLVVPGLLIPAFTQVFLDQVLIQSRSDWLRPLLGALLVAVAAQGFLRFVQLRCLRRLRTALSARMTTEFFQHLLRLPVQFYAQRYAGEISSRNQLNEKVSGVLSGQLAQTSIDVVMMAFYALTMLLYDVDLTLIGIGFAVLNFVALRHFSKWRVEANMRFLQEHGKVAGAAIAGLQSIETIKASGMESGFFHRWSGYFANASNARQGIELANQVLGLLPGLLTAVTTMLVLVLGGMSVIEGRMTIGMLVAFQLLMSSFLMPVGNLVRLGQTLQELQGDMARLDDVLDQEPDPSDVMEDEAPRATPQRQTHLYGQVELIDVTFGFNPSQPPLIQDFCLKIRPGQRVALVGGSGSGKTTLAKLVCGLYEPWYGSVLLDGRDRRKVPRALRTNSLALIDQDILLFGGTVRDNLTLWDETVSDETLRHACRDAEILDRVNTLPGGLDSELSEGGGNLSGGERQRLEIARALVSNPTILVLDEATSALDTESERQIVERLTLRGCSCIIVAHRLSTIRDCDEIIVLDRGQVVERGTHAELWERGGAYAALLREGEGELVEAG